VIQVPEGRPSPTGNAGAAEKLIWNGFWRERVHELARQAKPKLLILYHYSGLSREELFDDMLARYSGHFVIGRDLDVY